MRKEPAVIISLLLLVCLGYSIKVLPRELGRWMLKGCEGRGDNVVCFKDVISKYRDPDGCGRVGGYDDRELCIVQTAIILKAPGLCDGITEEFQRDWCIDYVAIANTDPKLCEQMIDEEKRKICRTEAPYVPDVIGYGDLKPRIDLYPLSGLVDSYGVPDIYFTNEFNQPLKIIAVKYYDITDGNFSSYCDFSQDVFNPILIGPGNSTRMTSGGSMVCAYPNAHGVYTVQVAITYETADSIKQIGVAKWNITVHK